MQTDKMPIQRTGYVLYRALQGFSGCLSGAKFKLYACAKVYDQCARVLNVSKLQVDTMPNPHSLDLRWRVVWLSLTGHYSAIQIAQLLNLSERTVRRYITTFQQSWDVEPKQYI